VGDTRYLERATRGRARRPGERGREIYGQPRSHVLRQDQRHGPLNDVGKREARAEVIAVEDDAGVARGRDLGHWLLRGDGEGERKGGDRREEQQQRCPPHGGRLKLIVMSFVTEMIDGSPAVSCTSRRLVVVVPLSGPPACGLAARGVGTPLRGPGEISRPLAGWAALAAF